MRNKYQKINQMVDFFLLTVVKYHYQSEEIKADEIWRAEYMQSLLREQEREDAAFDRGETSKAIKIAKNLLKLETPIEKIAIATGISIEEIKKLKKL